MKIAWKKAICYSGYREGQSPVTGIIPTKEEILEDLMLLKEEGFSYLRMYDPNAHARRVLELIKEHSLPFSVMVGIDPRAEYNNKGCPWLKTEKTTLELEENMVYNDAQIQMLAELANEYKEYFLAVSIGNENRPSWGADLVTEERLVGFAATLREKTGLPVTYCEGAGEWKNLGKLAEVLDFISIHSYPLWNGKTLKEAVRMNESDYREVVSLYPDKQVIFTECGWTTACNSSMDASQVGEEQQKKYLNELLFWTKSMDIPVFLFEAFDEPWKGGPSPQEPEKHWGIFGADRVGKQVIKERALS